jgi:hypothetical protein
MADFIPKFKPGQSWSALTSANVTGGKLLEVSGDGTVAHAGANSVAVVGVAAFDANSGDTVTVYSPKIAVLVASGAITAGSQVVAGSAGVVTALAAVTTPTAGDVTGSRAIVGVALTTAASNLVKVLFTR